MADGDSLIDPEVDFPNRPTSSSYVLSSHSDRVQADGPSRSETRPDTVAGVESRRAGDPVGRTDVAGVSPVFPGGGSVPPGGASRQIGTRSGVSEVLNISEPLAGGASVGVVIREGAGGSEGSLLVPTVFEGGNFEAWGTRSRDFTGSREYPSEGKLSLWKASVPLTQGNTADFLGERGNVPTIHDMMTDLMTLDNDLERRRRADELEVVTCLYDHEHHRVTPTFLAASSDRSMPCLFSYDRHQGIPTPSAASLDRSIPRICSEREKIASEIQLIKRQLEQLGREEQKSLPESTLNVKKCDEKRMKERMKRTEDSLRMTSARNPELIEAVGTSDFERKSEIKHSTSSVLEGCSRGINPMGDLEVMTGEKRVVNRVWPEDGVVAETRSSKARIRPTVDVSQGRDVASSKERLLLEALANETSSEENTETNLKLNRNKRGSDNAFTKRRSDKSQEMMVIGETSESEADTKVNVQEKSRKRVEPMRNIKETVGSPLKKNKNERETRTEDSDDSADLFQEEPRMRTPLSKNRITPVKLSLNKNRTKNQKESWSEKGKAKHLQIRREKQSEYSSESDKEKGTKGFHRNRRVTEQRKRKQYPRGINFLKPERYDGTTPLEIFLLQFDNCVEYNGWDKDESLAQLKGALKGTAAQVLMGNQGKAMDYNALRSELNKCFGVEGHTAQYRTMLKTRRRQPGESLRTLYQDIGRLLMLAYPGPQNDLRDLLAVEAFVDSLDDSELEVSVKDKFPRDLAEAFQAALRLEANRPSMRKVKYEERGERPVSDTRVRSRGRNDIESRRVEWHEEDVLREKLSRLEQEMKDTKSEVKRHREKEMEETRMNRLEGQVQNMELRNRLYEKAFEKDSAKNVEVNEIKSQIPPAKSVENVSGTTALTGRFRDETGRILGMNSRDNRLVAEGEELVCTLCQSVGHYIASCPQAYCGNCNVMGHTRRVCKVNPARGKTAQKAICFGCGEEGHLIRDCPRKRGYVKTTPDQSVEQMFRSNAVRLKKASVVEEYSENKNKVYVDIECMGQERPFLLDSGSDVTIVPADFVKGIRLFPTNKRAFAANATEIDLLGEVTVELKIGNILIPTRVIVSNSVAEGLIGYDWLANNDVFWGFGFGRILIQGQVVPLSARSDEEIHCNRVVVQKSTTIPSFSETVIPARIIFGVGQIRSCTDETQAEHNMSMEPSETEHGLCVAGALLPPRSYNLPARIVNVSGRSVRLHEGETLGKTQVLKTADVIETECVRKGSAEAGADWRKELLEKVDSSVTQVEKKRLNDILNEYEDCFSQHEFDLGRTTVIRHQIDTGSSKPLKQVLRRHPLVHTEEIDRQVKAMLAQDVIESSSSPWSSNVVIVKKKDNSLRFCIDYRKLNDVTVKDSYPLPRITDCLDALSTGRYFSAFDLRSGYFQVMMEEEDKGKTSFVTRSGLYQFKVMPFGVTNGPATFQRLMDLTMAGLNYQICLVYLDDIILMSRTVEEHLERLVLILDRLRKAGLKLKPSKCSLLQKRIHFLGHVVSEDGIATDPLKVQAVVEWPEPTNTREVRSFVGLCSYYRRFVQDFARIAEPLHKLTGKRVKFEWDSACQLAFEKLKGRLVTSPILAMPQDEGQYRLDTDASDDAIGAVLSQIQNGEERVIAYASRLLNRAERNYCVTRRELLAVVYFCKQFRTYLLGRQFLIRTDHSALRWLRNMPDPIGQQARWLELLEEYQFEVEHRPGKKHINADALSRKPCRQCTRDEDTVVVGMIKVDKKNSQRLDSERLFHTDELARDYAKDTLATFHRLFQDGAEQIPWEDVIGLDRVTKGLWRQWDRMTKVEGVLYREWISSDGLVKRLQLVPPQSIRRELMKRSHEGVTGGHMGMRRTLHQLQLRAYWPGWQDDVRKYCQRCDTCATYHRGAPKKQGLLQLCPVGEPWERVAVDLTGPHPVSRSGHVYILTVLDMFTKWAEAIPLKNKEAITVARALVDVVFTRFGIPLQLLSDNGKEFDNAVLKEMCRLLEIDKLRTTVYKASTNGAVERFHRTLNAMLGKVVATNQKDWDAWLPSIMGAYRASCHESTGYSPNFMMFGRENLAPLDVILGIPVGEAQHYGSCDDFVDQKVQQMREAYQLARENLGCRAERAKRNYDMRVKPSQYCVGQWVYYYCPRRYQGRSVKWQRMYTGPFLIVQQMGPVNVRLQASKRSQPFIVHVDKLKPCFGVTPTSWLGAPEEEEDTSLLGTVGVELNKSMDEELNAEKSREIVEPASQMFDEHAERQRYDRPRREMKKPLRFKDYR
jgi:transposase InsO family protein